MPRIISYEYRTIFFNILYKKKNPTNFLDVPVFIFNLELIKKTAHTVPTIYFILFLIFGNLNAKIDQGYIRFRGSGA